MAGMRPAAAAPLSSLRRDRKVVLVIFTPLGMCTIRAEEHPLWVHRTLQLSGILV